MTKTLVAYFSASGVTANTAKELAKAVDADLFEIKPEVPYTEADLNWRDKNSRSSVEMSDVNCRPAIAACDGIDQYDEIYVGFPIWWGREPSAVDTFLTSLDFSGKKIIPFCTSGGSPMGDTAARIQNLVGPHAEVAEGKRLAGTISQADLKTWTEGLQ